MFTGVPATMYLLYANVGPPDSRLPIVVAVHPGEVHHLSVPVLLEERVYLPWLIR